MSDLSREGFDHRRLADAGFTGEENHLAPTLGGLLQATMQLLHHILTFDNGRRQLGVGSRQFLVTAPWPLLPVVCCRLTSFCGRNHGHRRDETIASSMHGGDEPRGLGYIPQGPATLAD